MASESPAVWEGCKRSKTTIIKEMRGHRTDCRSSVDAWRGLMEGTWRAYEVGVGVWRHEGA